ncbi:hypothetical protein J19TS1_14820 [Heyndrickxia oleronia]|nr:hypothetical protein J19TS1_14820 [Heyndrickxia oleronia]
MNDFLFQIQECGDRSLYYFYCQEWVKNKNILNKNIWSKSEKYTIIKNCDKNVFKIGLESRIKE